MGGWTNQVTHECLGRNLSPSIYGWKDEPSHLQVPWSKIKVLLPMCGRTNQTTSKWLGKKFKSFYLRVEGRTKSHTSVLVEIYVLLPMDGGRTSHSRLTWSKFKSSYLRVEGRTKPPVSALVQNWSPSTYGWKDEPSHSRVSWSKFKSFYLRVEGRTKSLTSALVKILSPTT